MARAERIRVYEERDGELKPSPGDAVTACLRRLGIQYRLIEDACGSFEIIAFRPKLVRSTNDRT